MNMIGIQFKVAVRFAEDKLRVPRIDLTQPGTRVELAPQVQLVRVVLDGRILDIPFSNVAAFEMVDDGTSTHATDKVMDVQISSGGEAECPDCSLEGGLSYTFKLHRSGLVECLRCGALLRPIWEDRWSAERAVHIDKMAARWKYETPPRLEQPAGELSCPPGPPPTPPIIEETTTGKPERKTSRRRRKK